ncbi:MAG: double zinc ribbon domain-containing protein [Promethearchaeati archaeon]
MSVDSPDTVGKRLSYACILSLILLSIFLILLVFQLFWAILFLMFIAPLIMLGLNRYFFRPEIKCPRCNATVSSYSDRCSHCGFQLITKCPKCGASMRYNDEVCNNCGYSIKKLIIPENVELNFEYKENDSQKPQKKVMETRFTFCPHCGSKLNENQQNLRYCEYCGNKL